MSKSISVIGLSLSLALTFVFCPAVAGQMRSDTIPTSAGVLNITLIGHASLMFEHSSKIVHVDPWTNVGNYSKLPKADLILITHHHGDHLDLNALKEVVKDNTQMVVTMKGAEKLGNQFKNPIIMANGDVQTVAGFRIEAVPAYNLVHIPGSSV